MPPSLNAPSVMTPATLPPVRIRIASTVAVVALAHIALIAAIMQMTQRQTPPLSLESKVIMAQLLSQETAPVAAAPAPPALRSAPEPIPHPVVKKKVEPHVAPPRPLPAPKPAPATPKAVTSPEPAPTAAPAQESASSQPAKAPEQPAAQSPAAGPASSRETLAIAAPKAVPHIDCRIVKPDYPALSRRRGETGTADVRFVVGATGTIESVALAKSSGYPRLDDAALAAMRASSCRPYVENGTPIRVTYTQPFGFALDD
ncbi:energy transducer TonB [Trinickia symbiotica]|uniref:Energy transducer TonB n=1 Tax=Trinickia symbiotica TaxID=863227 RepID=A0A2T3XW42_9BURK|nr:energy transducer TonB [Trinickia symbiotica]PTB20721.1 energy transducer TonB [Trinickia symbiotica]